MSKLRVMTALMVSLAIGTVLRASAAKADNCDSSELRKHIAALFTGGVTNREVLHVGGEAASDECRMYVVGVGDRSSKADPHRGNRKPLRIPMLQVANFQLRNDGSYVIKGDEALVWDLGVNFSEVKHSEDRELQDCNSSVIGERIMAASDTMAAASESKNIKGSKSVGRIMRLYGANAGSNERVVACSFFVPRVYKENSRIYAIAHEILVRSFSSGHMNLEWSYVPLDVLRYLHAGTLENKRWLAGYTQARQ